MADEPVTFCGENGLKIHLGRRRKQQHRRAPRFIQLIEEGATRPASLTLGLGEVAA